MSWECLPPEAVDQKCSVMKGVLRNFAKLTGKHLCQSLFRACNFIKKETLAQAFSCEFREISKNTHFKENVWVTASVPLSNSNNRLDVVCAVLRPTADIMLKK